jgi:hypothetical protein
MEKPGESPEAAPRGFQPPEAEVTPTVPTELDPDSLQEFLADLDRWADEMRQRADTESEAVEKIYYSRLPEALFHATTKEGARKVRVEGLKPSPLQFEDNKVISLSDSIQYAKFCASQTQGVPPDELTILEITTQGIDREEAKSYLQMDNPYIKGEKLHEVHYAKAINPDWIHELTPEEAAEIERAESSS